MLLYGVVLVILTPPIIVAAIAPEMTFSNSMEVFSVSHYWILLGVFLFCQAVLLLARVGAISKRPESRRPIVYVLVTTGLMFALLLLGLSMSLAEAIAGVKALDWSLLYCGVFALVSWLWWAIFFRKLYKNNTVEDVITRQCKLLYRGSVLELLVVVPSHIIARQRTDCCAGLVTFFGLATGIAVMLFAFGPAVLLLLYQRSKR